MQSSKDQRAYIYIKKIESWCTSEKLVLSHFGFVALDYVRRECKRVKVSWKLMRAS
jgi:hypothetical protein